MTVFFWTQNTGKLAASSDKEKVKYYKEAIEIETGGSLDNFAIESPVIRAPHTNWEPIEMVDVIEYCQQNDIFKPDFLSELSRSGSIRLACTGDDPVPLNQTEQEVFDKYTGRYYENNWHRVILALLGGGKPQVACKEKITLEQLRKD